MYQLLSAMYPLAEASNDGRSGHSTGGRNQPSKAEVCWSENSLYQYFN